MEERERQQEASASATVINQPIAPASPPPTHTNRSPQQPNFLQRLGNAFNAATQVAKIRPDTTGLQRDWVALREGLSRYEGASAEEVAQAVAGDIDLFAFGALGRLDKAMGGSLAESKHYKQGQDLGTPFAVATVFLGGVGLVRGGYLLYRSLSAAKALPAALQVGKNAETGIDVYAGVKNGKAVYTGITNDLERRAAEHGSRFDLLRALTPSPVMRGEARAIEQAMIVRNRLQNMKNSISPSHPWY